MATSTIPAPKAQTASITLTPGQTLTITTRQYTMYSLFVSVDSNSFRGLYYLCGYSNSNATANKSITALLDAGASITVSKSTSAFTIVNEHATANAQLNLLIINNYNSALSWSVS